MTAPGRHALLDALNRDLAGLRAALDAGRAAELELLLAYAFFADAGEFAEVFGSWSNDGEE